MKDCRRWRNPECPVDATCVKWDKCTLMNDNAVTITTEDVKDD